MQPLLKLRRKPIVRLNLVREQRVSACRRCIEDIQKRRARRLIFVRNVRMPRDSVDPCLEELLSSIVICTSMYQVDFGMAWRGSARWMDVQTAEILADI